MISYRASGISTAVHDLPARASITQIQSPSRSAISTAVQQLPGRRVNHLKRHAIRIGHQHMYSTDFNIDNNQHL